MLRIARLIQRARIYKQVAAMHPDLPALIGEAGWATQRLNEREHAELIKGKPGDDEQKRCYEALTAWFELEGITAFFFKAFEEN